MFFAFCFVLLSFDELVDNSASINDLLRKILRIPWTFLHFTFLSRNLVDQIWIHLFSKFIPNFLLCFVIGAYSIFFSPNTQLVKSLMFPTTEFGGKSFQSIQTFLRGQFIKTFSFETCFVKKQRTTCIANRCKNTDY